MNELNVKEQYNTILSLLGQKRLYDALKQLESFIFGITDWDMRRSLEDMQTSYNYMLQYMMEGMVDPDRNKLYNQLTAKAYQLNDQIRIAHLTTTSGEYYFDRLRYYKLMPLRPLQELQLQLESYTEDMAVGNLLKKEDNQESELAEIRKRHETATSELFYRIWLSGKWNEADENEAKNFLNSVLVQINDLSLFVSALTLSLIEQFDIRKFILLFDAYQHSAKEVNQRAIVGIALITFLYDNRLSIYPEVSARLKLLNEDVIFANNLSRVQIQLLRCRETKKIDKKMREEIIPEMIKNVNLNNRKLDMDEPEDDNFNNDKNPDWEDWMEQSGLSDKLKEMSDLQMEGADVYMSTFAQLKTYPFFREMANWFYPFDTQNSSVVQAFSTTNKKRNILLDTILQSGFFCNSDKYSFCFTITQIPEAQREMMAQQFESQNSAINEAQSYDKMIAYSQQADTISNQYIHDLYRFFKIHPRRHEFRDIFEDSLNLQYCQTFKETLSDTNNQLTLAGYFFHKDYLLEALLLYQDIAQKNGGDAEIYQKIGFCLQKNKNYEKAVDAYLQADILKPDNVWTNRHLATCYKKLKQYEKALKYYEKVESVQPENLSVLSQIGYCLVGLKRYEEALAYFFKLEYLNNESVKTWQAIAWCSFVIGKTEQALKYYKKSQNAGLDLQDYLNAGHVYWVLGQTTSAIEMYVFCFTLCQSEELFFSLFNKDKEELLRQGIKEEEIPLMLDLIRSCLPEKK